jgi:hypothetical protein
MDFKAMRDHLFLMRRSVARSEDSIAWQKQLVGTLLRAGKDADKAQRLLSSIEETHGRNLEHRDRLEQELSSEPVPPKKD